MVSDSNLHHLSTALNMCFASYHHHKKGGGAYDDDDKEDDDGENDDDDDNDDEDDDGGGSDNKRSYGFCDDEDGDGEDEKESMRRCRLVKYVSKFLRHLVNNKKRVHVAKGSNRSNISNNDRDEVITTKNANPINPSYKNTSSKLTSEKAIFGAEKNLYLDFPAPKISGFSQLPIRCQNYEEITREMIRSEQVYNSDLKVIVNKFRGPVCTSLHSNRSLMSWQNAKLLFDNVVAIYNLSW